MKTLGKLTASLCFLCALSASAGIEFRGFQTHSHIIANVDPEVSYLVEKIEEKGKLIGLRLVLKNVREELETLKGSSDFRTDEISVKKDTGSDSSRVVYEVFFSEKAVAAGVDFFDYRNKAPSQIFLDYWLKSQKPGHEKTIGSLSAAKVAQNQTKLKNAINAAKSKSGRTNDPTLLAGCGTPISVKTDPFVFWKTYHEPYDYHAFFNLMPADSKYTYQLVEKKKGENFGKRSKEVAHYRLAHKLYKEGQYALTLRTMDFFEKSYPKSELLSDLRFLKASTLTKLSALLRTTRYEEQALDLYRSILLEAPDSERGKASLAFLVQENMKRGTPVMALEYALMGTEQKPQESQDGDLTPWVYRLAAAEALMALGEYDRAERSFQNVMDSQNKLSPEAAFRIGEVYASRQFWERAILAYEKAIQVYPKESLQFAPIWLNLAEAYFRIEKYDEAERVYNDFEKHFSTSKFAWAAKLRIAELQQIKLKTPDLNKHESISKLYEKVVNTHPYTPGAMLAELRLAACINDLRGIDKHHESREFFLNMFAARDLKAFESELIDKTQTEGWFDYVEAKFRAGSGEYREALASADTYRGTLGKYPFGPALAKVYSIAVNGLVNELAKKGLLGAKEILAVVEHYGDWAAKPLTVEYELTLAKANQEIGNFEKTEEKLSELKGRLSEFNQESKDLYQLLITQQMRLKGEPEDRILSELRKISDTGLYADAKYDLLADLAERKKDYSAAIEYDSKLLDTDLVNMLTIERKLEISLRRLENTARIKNPEAVYKLSNQILFKYGTRTEYQKVLSRVLDLRAVALYDMGNFKGVVEAVGEILSNQPEHPRRSEFEFMRGKSLVSLGRDSEALETFRKLAQTATAESKDEIWKKSAQAELDQIQWEGKVQNLIQDRRSVK